MGRGSKGKKIEQEGKVVQWEKQWSLAVDISWCLKSRLRVVWCIPKIKLVGWWEQSWVEYKWFGVSWLVWMSESVGDDGWIRTCMNKLVGVDGWIIEPK